METEPTELLGTEIGKLHVLLQRKQPSSHRKPVLFEVDVFFLLSNRSYFPLSFQWFSFLPSSFYLAQENNAAFFSLNEGCAITFFFFKMDILALINVVTFEFSYNGCVCIYVSFCLYV